VNDSTTYPQDFAHTDVGVNDSGVIIGSTTYINRGATFSGATGVEPDYDPIGLDAPNFFTGTISHEIGHAIGLADTGERPCNATSTSTMGPACGTNNRGDGANKPDPASIKPTSCDQGTVQINIVSPASNGSLPGDGIDPGSGYATGGSGYYDCSSYDEWDDQTNTLTAYTFCSLYDT
jgi:hypothetical protein